MSMMTGTPAQAKGEINVAQRAEELLKELSSLLEANPGLCEALRPPACGPSKLLQAIFGVGLLGISLLGSYTAVSKVFFAG